MRSKIRCFPPQNALSILVVIGFLFVGQSLTVPTTLKQDESTSTSASTSSSISCKGSSNLEHLTGECMFQYECVQRKGWSIGSCFRNHIVGSCCVIKEKDDQMKLMNFDQAKLTPEPIQNPISTDTTLTTQSQTLSINTNPTTKLPIITTNNPNPTQLDSIIAKLKPGTGVVVKEGESQFYEIITSNTRKTTTSPKSLQKPIFPSNSATTTLNSNVTKSEALIDLDSSNGLFNAQPYDPSTNGWFQPNPVPGTHTAAPQLPSVQPTLQVPVQPSIQIPSIQNPSIQSPSIQSPSIQPATQPQPQQPPPSIPNTHVEDIFSNHFPGLAPTSSTTQPPPVNHYPTMGKPRPTIATTPSPQDLAHQKYTCGVRPLRPTGRVVGGRNAAFGEWPWQVLIKESGWLGLFMKPKCGGVLIDDRWVLTAAHCQPGVMGSLMVMLGQHQTNGENQQLKPLIKTVRRMIVHRDYNPETFDNDIALLELDTPFELKPHVVPICLPEVDYNLVGEFAHVAGFGKLYYGGNMPQVLQTVKLPIIANHQCQSMFSNAGHHKYIRDSFLCAGYPQGGKDTCEGDSGGPLMVEKNGVWTLVGTVSHGIKCAEPNMPGVYMKTFAYLDWIKGITGRR